MFYYYVIFFYTTTTKIKQHTEYGKLHITTIIKIIIHYGSCEGWIAVACFPCAPHTKTEFVREHNNFPTLSCIITKHYRQVLSTGHGCTRNLNLS